MTGTMQLSCFNNSEYSSIIICTVWITNNRFWLRWEGKWSVFIRLFSSEMDHLKHLRGSLVEVISLRLPSPLHDASESKLQLSFTEIIYHNEDFNLCYYYTLRQICLYPSLFFSPARVRRSTSTWWCCLCSDWLSFSPNYPFKERMIWHCYYPLILTSVISKVRQLGCHCYKL